MSSGVAVESSPNGNQGSEMTADESAAFNLDNLVQHLSSCITANDSDILLDEYIDAYRDIKRMINLFGGLFTFVNSDVRAKLLILEHHRRSSDAEKYVSISSMIEFERSALPGFEKQRSAIQIHGRDNACRTLLRLHRAMKFLESMFRGLCESELSASMRRSSSGNLQAKEKSSDSKTDSAYSVVSDAYETHLAGHHTWIVRNMVRVALRAVPSRSAMMKCIVNSQRDTASTHGSSTQVAESSEQEDAIKTRLLELLIVACDKMKLIHAITQKFYEQSGLLSLP